MSKTTITINGRVYDAITGMPVVTHTAHTVAPKSKQPAMEHVPSQTATPHTRAFSDIAPTQAQKEPGQALAAAAGKRKPDTPAAQSVHQTTQKSHTLYRKALKKPQVEPSTANAKVTSSRSPMISRFGAERPASAPSPEPPREPHEQPPQQAVMHPAVAKALQHQATTGQQQTHQPSGKQLKELLIKERLAEVGNSPAKKEKRSKWLSRQPKMVTILSTTLALLILGGYLTYITLPSISLRVAASRAGVNASMPEYKPDGYSLDGAITYSPGEVVISYASNTNETGYKLTQKATNWDSQAVLDNYVSRMTDNYLTFQERGITVYTFGNKAAWVNGGLLYTIDGNAALSSDQILRVATSL